MRVSRRVYCSAAALMCVVLQAARADFIPNDVYFGPYQWALKKMNVPRAWDYSLGNPSVKIGVLDTGIIFGTPDLQGHTLAPLSALDPAITEGSALKPHGTWVASTIGMTINNSIGGAGTGNFSILPIRVTNDNEQSDDQWITQGIAMAAQNDCRVITISVTANSYPVINAAVAQALQSNQSAGRRDFLVFMSAGNGNTRKLLQSADLDNASARMASDHLIMVAGTDQNDAHWFTSTFFASDVGPFVDLSAPAKNILVANGVDTMIPYGTSDGTSFSTPFAASAAAMAFSINPDLTASEVQSLLFDTAFNPNNPHAGTSCWDETFGWGRVDFGALAAAAQATLSPAGVPEPATLAMTLMPCALLIIKRRRIPGSH